MSDTRPQPEAALTLRGVEVLRPVVAFSEFGAIAPVGPGEKHASFLDVDWWGIFGEMRLSYPKPYRDRILNSRDESGRVDATKLPFGNPELYLDAISGKPKIDLIINDIKSGRIGWERLLIAIPDSSVINPKDKAAVQQALLEHMSRWIISGNPIRLIEILENIVPVWFDSFQIIENTLPKIMRHPYIDAIPRFGYDHMDPAKMRALLTPLFPTEVDQLLAELSQVGEWYFVWQKLAQGGPLPLKRIEQPVKKLVGK